MYSILIYTLTNIGSPNGGLPGINSTEKANFPKGELFKMRNEVLGWYCAENSPHLHLLPCKVFEHLKTNRNLVYVNDDYMESEIAVEKHVINSNKNNAKNSYRSMFKIFCEHANTVRRDEICNNKLFVTKYIN
tara:strand:- start:66 stop:464 length:399 start_codon:yes stop_codon:yes gene_type:complete